MLSDLISAHTGQKQLFFFESCKKKKIGRDLLKKIEIIESSYKKGGNMSDESGYNWYELISVNTPD